ncbi:MAG: DUF2169 domain-containing protein [Myxococcales bacterium]|nr:DUF2169 domain-containing protein [Myxococcales bacterium]
MARWDDPVAVTALPGAVAATVVWRWKGERFVTAIVKATFSLVAGARMMLVPPEPILRDEQEPPSRVGLQTAGDLAPYLQQTDVTLVGQAPVPAGYIATTVRLAIVRDGAPLLDVRRDVEAPPRAGGGAVSVPIAGMGPISRHSAARGALLGACDPERVTGTELDVPVGFAWEFYQAAPTSQRIAHLAGHELVTLAGVSRRWPTLTTQLPEERGAALLCSDGGTRPLTLVLDTLQIDADRLSCTLTWRGHEPLGDRVELRALRILAGVGTRPEQLLAWVVDSGRRRDRVDDDDDEAGVGARPNETRKLGKDEVARLVARALPFALRGTPVSPADPDEDGARTPHTRVLSGAEAAAAVAVARRAVPFPPDAAAPRALPVSPAAPDEDDDGARTPHTRVLSRAEAAAAAAVARRAVPFAPEPVRSAGDEEDADDHPTVRPPPPSSTKEETGVLDVASLRRPAVPFAAVPSQPGLEAPPSQPEAPRAPAPETPLRELARAVPAVPAVTSASRPRPERLDIERYAAIKRAIWSSPRAKDRVLEDAGLSSLAWLEQERLWDEALTREALEGESSLALELAERMRKS